MENCYVAVLQFRFWKWKTDIISSAKIVEVKPNRKTLLKKPRSVGTRAKFSRA